MVESVPTSESEAKDELKNPTFRISLARIGGFTGSVACASRYR
jgi:hypothetical protein